MINIFLVDDQQIVLDGLQRFLKDAPDIKVMGVAHNGQDLLQQLQSAQNSGSLDAINLVLMDVNMPVMDGFEATRRLKSRYPQIKVLILSMRDQEEDIKQAMMQGADGFLSKSKGKSAIIDAIRKVSGKELNAP